MNLPPELHVKIVKGLPWQDVLQVRKVTTCKILLQVTQTWEIWAHLVYEHISSKLDPPRLERPIERYSSKELEDLFLRWKGTEIAWKTDGGFPTLQRTFISITGAPRYSHLVKGGRWYLTTAYGTAEVTYYDLEADNITGVQLIPPQAYDCRENDIRVALEVHTETQYLEFTMAFSVFNSVDGRALDSDDSGYDDGHKSINIWRIVCILDDSGRAIGLSATKLATIPNRPSFLGVFSLSLRGPLICMTALNCVQCEWFIILVEWERAHGQEQFPMRIIDLCDTETSLYLLPNNHLLCHRDEEFLLYDYSAAQETNMVSEDGINLESVLVWSLPARDQASGRIELGISCVRNTTRTLFFGNYALFSLSFQDGSHEPPSLVQVMELPNVYLFYAPALGINRSSVFIHETKTFQLMTLTYRPTLGGSSIASPLFVSRSLGPSSALIDGFLDHPIDEDIGRIVLPAHSRNRPEAFVVDFSKYL